MTTAAVASDELRRMLAEDGHSIRGDKIHCLNPAHDDRNPSEHVFGDDRGGHVYCFSCGHHLDAVEYLVEHRGTSMREALMHLGLSEGPVMPTQRRARAPVVSAPVRGGCGAKRPLRQLPEGFLKRHEAYVEQTFRIPPALSGRGFQVEDIPTLLMAEGQDGDGLFAIFGAAGELLNVKRRLAQRRGDRRYLYEVAGNGSPAWCSPGIADTGEVLIIEGELNAAVCWLVRKDLGVMGPAGANGCLHLEPLKGKAVHIYADGDEAGAKARERWARQAHDAGAIRVHLLDPWPDGDACDVAGRLSRAHLRSRLP